MSAKKPIPFKTIPTLEQLKSNYPEIKALFFDMDGTLFNTEKYHEIALLNIAEEYGIKTPYTQAELHEMLMGKADHLAFEIVRHWENFPKHWLVRDFVETKNAYLLDVLMKVSANAFFPDETLSLLRQARSADLSLALITSSEKVITKELLKIAGLENYFDLELTRDDCPLHKPHPWPYNSAMEFFHCAPSEVLIFEDSDVGLEAAIASKAHVIKVEWF